MSIKDKLRGIFSKTQETPTEPNKKMQIAENRRKLHEIKGNEPFEIGYGTNELGIDDCIYVSDTYDKDNNTRTMTIVNPIYKFNDNGELKLVGARMFERDKFYVGEEQRAVTREKRTIKNLSAEEFKELQQQKINEQILAKKTKLR